MSRSMIIPARQTVRYYARRYLPSLNVAVRGNMLLTMENLEDVTIGLSSQGVHKLHAVYIARILGQ